jgi:spermidine/putrescine transport system permease protein
MATRRGGGGGRTPWYVPYLLLAPGVIWLVLFFLVPIWYLLRTALSVSDDVGNTTLTWRWANFADSWTLYHDQYMRSFWYALLATILCIVIGYPLAYVIAFRGGRYKTLLLGLVVVPFFTSYLVRTLAWKTILQDNGPLVRSLNSLHLLGSTNDRLLSTSWAVIGGLTYNFLPFMILPIYVSLEKIDPRLVEAGKDLYSNAFRAFRKVVLPLSLPGVIAGSLLVFIPAAGDFVNAALLGSSDTRMIGNVVQGNFLSTLDYPSAAAISFVLMAIIVVLVAIYTRILGTEDLTT